jgi:magnesium-transporting ATPase (P-type)
MGLSHLPRNAGIFSTADISVGADVLAQELATVPACPKKDASTDHLLPHEVEFVAAVSAHSCAFNLRGAASSSLIPSIIERARASLEAVYAAAYFMLFGSISFSVYVFFCMCSASTAVPFVPTLGSVLYLQVVLPLLSLGLAMSDTDDESMHRVPPKNDQSIAFSRKEGNRLYTNTFLKALLPTVLTCALYLIAFGQLMIKFDPKRLQEECSMSANDIKEKRWTSVIRCEPLKAYSGEARTSASALILAELVLCVIIGSASFVYATASVVEMPPWSRNHCWAFMSLLSIVFVAIYLVVSLEKGSFSALSWYFFVLAAIMPFLCLLGNELIKQSERKHIERAAKLRRLQFETRYVWSCLSQY